MLRGQFSLENLAFHQGVNVFLEDPILDSHHLLNSVYFKIGKEKIQFKYWPGEKQLVFRSPVVARREST